MCNCFQVSSHVRPRHAKIAELVYPHREENTSASKCLELSHYINIVLENHMCEVCLLYYLYQRCNSQNGLRSLNKVVR